MDNRMIPIYIDEEGETICTIEPAEALFSEHGAEFLLEVLRAVAETGFPPEPELAEVLEVHGSCLAGVDRMRLTKAFEGIMAAAHAGKALGLLESNKLLEYFISRKIYKTMNKNEKKALRLFIQNIDDTMPVLQRRLIVFYLGFFKKRDYEALNYLSYSLEFREKEAYVHRHIGDFQYLDKKKKLKRFLYEEGYENYQLLDNITKIQSRVYELDRRPVLARHNLLVEIAEKNEAVFVEDLAIRTEDLLEHGLAASREKGEEILRLLIHYIHKWPRFNTREILLDQAKKLQRHKWKFITMKMRRFQHE